MSLATGITAALMVIGVLVYVILCTGPPKKKKRLP